MFITLQRGADMKVLNFGSLNLDYVYSVDNFLRPGETKSAMDRNTFLGGKGFNQSIALAKAGIPVYHAGNAGESAGLFRKELEQYGADVRFLGEDAGICGHAVIQVDGRGQNCILIFHGANYNITEAYVDSVLDQFESGDMVVLQNEINTTHYIIEEAYKRGMKIALNPSPYDETIQKMPLEKLSWLILNEVEVKDLSGQETEEAYVRWFREHFPNLRVVVTLGRRGALYIDQAQVIRHPAYKTNIVDTTAAGDVFTGFFLGGQAQGRPVEETMQIASKAAGISVSRNGAAASAPTMDEVLATELEPLEL